jgi:hypothetical protein
VAYEVRIWNTKPGARVVETEDPKEAGIGPSQGTDLSLLTVRQEAGEDGAHKTGSHKAALRKSCPMWCRCSRREIHRLAQPVMRMDGMQRMAMMMALLVLGSPQIYGCRAHEVQEVVEALSSQYLDMCP